jgi:hypothetical protein
MACEGTQVDILDIFCDESGFTGQNLLNPDQRFFAYGSVAISPTEAAEVVAQTIRDFRLQGNELKGKNLLRHPSGGKAATALNPTTGRAVSRCDRQQAVRVGGQAL